MRKAAVIAASFLLSTLFGLGMAARRPLGESKGRATIQPFGSRRHVFWMPRKEPIHCTLHASESIECWATDSENHPARLVFHFDGAFGTNDGGSIHVRYELFDGEVEIDDRMAQTNGLAFSKLSDRGRLIMSSSLDLHPFSNESENSALLGIGTLQTAIACSSTESDSAMVSVAVLDDPRLERTNELLDFFKDTRSIRPDLQFSFRVSKFHELNVSIRLPRSTNACTGAMVLFGGRNWSGERTLREYGFEDLADRHGLALVSPSFVDNDYWKPEAWSGAALTNELARIERENGISFSRVCLYGYSAGGQCAALFQAWWSGGVTAWGAHGCGVFPARVDGPGAPALVTCGSEDQPRAEISRQFAYRYREAGGALLRKEFPSGHGLDPAALALAKAWFDAVLSEGGETNRLCGEDDTGRILPADRIDPEFRNPLPSDEVRRLWQGTEE